MSLYDQSRQMLSKRKNIGLANLYQAEQSLEEQMRARGIQQQAASGIQGGFTNDNQQVLQQEGQQAEQDIETEFQSELDIINETERQAKKQEADAKKARGWNTALSLGGTAIGALLAIPTGGMSLAAGAALGGGVGRTASGLLGYGDINSADVGQLMEGLGMLQSSLTSDDYSQMLGQKFNFMGTENPLDMDTRMELQNYKNTYPYSFGVN